MSKNDVFRRAEQLAVTCTAPTTPASGDPVLYGQRPGVALVNKDATTTKTSVAFCGEFNLSVKGINAGGNVAIAEGDIVYYTAGDTPPLSAKATGVRFGYAAGAVTSAATATIPVIVGY
jgi:predicted RecA/RadA family phage recombinase